jgi:hypothetical protein
VANHEATSACFQLFIKVRTNGITTSTNLNWKVRKCKLLVKKNPGNEKYLKVAKSIISIRKISLVPTLMEIWSFESINKVIWINGSSKTLVILCRD